MITIRRLHDEQGGWALVTCVIFSAILLVIGATTLGVVDQESRQTRIQRERESALNLAEGVLFAQSFTLARRWPGTNQPSFPSKCISSTPTTGQCPNAETLAGSATSRTNASFQGIDFEKDVTWVARVRDNYGGLANSFDQSVADSAQTGPDGTCAAPCARDFNGDRAMWVQARVDLRGEVRNVVALMKLEQLSEAVPQAGLVTGALRITNNGNKPMVDVNGSQVVVRCTIDVQLGQFSLCSNFRGGQIAPAPQQGNPGNLMDLAQIERFKERAIIDGTYYQSCPPQLAGRVVFVESCQTTPNYNNSMVTTACAPPPGMSPWCINSIQQPGVLIVRCGAMNWTGNWTYVGLVYFVNGSDGSCPGQQRGSSPPACTHNSLDANTVLDATGGAGVWGGLAADGNACVLLGSNGMQVRFDTRAFTGVQSYGTVGLVQNTWRELTPGPAL